MNCRYCGGIYAATERSCGGCGSPKTAIQTLLDVPAAPNHWSHSMGQTAQRMAIVSAGVAVAVVAMGFIGFENLAVGIAMLWIALFAPIGLGVGAWKSGKGELRKQVVNGIIALLLWFGIALALLIAIGIAVAD